MRWRFGLVAAVALTGATVAGSVSAQATAGETRLQGIRPDASGGRFALVLEASAPIAWAAHQPDPLTVLVDMKDVVSAAAQPAVWDSTPVSRVDIGETSSADGELLTRVRLALSAPAMPVVRAERNTIRVEFDEMPAAAGQGGAIVAPPPASRLVAVSTSEAGDRTTVTIRGNGRLVPRTVEEAADLPPRVLVDFPGVEPGVPAVTPVDSSTVARVRVALNSATPLVTRLVVDLKRRAPFVVERQDDTLRLIVYETAPPAGTTPPAGLLTSAPASTDDGTRASAVPAPDAMVAGVPADLPTTTVADTAPPPTMAPTAPGRVVTAEAASEIVATAAGTGVRDDADPTEDGGGGAYAMQASARPTDRVLSGRLAPTAFQTQPAEPAPAPAPAPPPPLQSPSAIIGGTQERQFTGHPVSLDFQGVDLRAVLRTFAEITGLNLVIDPAVQGTVDVALREVPWDQALDTILRANQLGYTVEGNIVRIAPLSKLREEQEETRKLAEARALSGDLQMLTRTLSYAKAEELTQLLTRAGLTQRGSIQVDRRTNTLIIRDLPGGLDAASQLITTLDRPQAQVEIEARIVQTNRNFLRELGVRWGLSGEASQRLANGLPLTFPNQAVIDGVTELPTTNAPTSVIGLATSSINGAFNLDVELQAAEREGKVRILSTPRVSTQNNVEAEISQGTQIPVQTVANNTITVTFKDATLTLRVRPQITSSNTVIMNVVVENATPDFTREVNGIPPIDTQRANTQVQVSDGATTVIGGIFLSTEREVQDRTPGLHRLPLLGWLFKSNNRSDTSQELLIFLTPRIIKG
jgi:type IV pilus assembly protein PilQ